MKLNIEQTLEKAITAHQEEKFEEAEHLYVSILKVEPQHSNVHNNLANIKAHHSKFEDAIAGYMKAIELKPNYVEAYNNLGIIQYQINRKEEAEISFRKAIEFKPDNFEAHYNLANTIRDLNNIEEKEFVKLKKKELNKLDEVIEIYKKAIELKPDYIEAYNNLGIVQHKNGRTEDAEINFRKAIQFKPDNSEAYNNLANVLNELNKIDEAVEYYEKAIELNPDYADAYNNLGILFTTINKKDEAEKNFKKSLELNPELVEAKNNLSVLLIQKQVLLKINQVREFKDEIKVGSLDSNKGLISNPFISNRKVETELLSYLYSINTKELTKTVYADARYGNAICSNFQLFEDNSVAVKKVEKDLTDIMNQAVKSEIYILDSFFNILRAGSGTTPHDHISNFDKVQEITNQKFSLTYYLSTGDQNCSEPGTLKFYEPNEEILPTEGMIAIIPAYRKHSAVYNGKTDRVMIGINFYSLT